MHYFLSLTSVPNIAHSHLVTSIYSSLNSPTLSNPVEPSLVGVYLVFFSTTISGEMDLTDLVLRTHETSTNYQQLSEVSSVGPATPPESLPSSPLSVLSIPSSVYSAPDRVATTFEYFPLLPSKIRFKIWQFAVHNLEPRYVVLQDNFYCTGFFFGIKANCRSPALLDVCKESRNAVLERFEIAFGFSYRSKTFPHRICFDYVLDTLVFYFNWPTRMSMDLPYFTEIVSEDSLQKVQSLIIDEREIILPYAIDILLDFPSLKKLTIVPVPAELVEPSNATRVNRLSKQGQRRLSNFLSRNPRFRDTVDVTISVFPNTADSSLPPSSDFIDSSTKFISSNIDQFIHASDTPRSLAPENMASSPFADKGVVPFLT